MPPAAREMPKLDRRGGRRKAEENSLEVGNEVLTSEASVEVEKNGGRIEVVLCYDGREKGGRGWIEM